MPTVPEEQHASVVSFVTWHMACARTTKSKRVLSRNYSEILFAIIFYCIRFR